MQSRLDLLWAIKSEVVIPHDWNQQVLLKTKYSNQEAIKRNKKAKSC